MRFLIVTCLLLAPTFILAQSTVESIPNQKTITGSYVSSPDNLLDTVTIRRMDLILKSIEDRTTVQVAVVAVSSIAHEDIFEFSQRLFTHWGIGNKSNDNGLLILFVLDDRTVRFHTGSGVEGVLPDVVCKRIQRDYMVPEFRDGNINAGMLAGVVQVEKVLTNPAYADELKSAEDNDSNNWIGFVAFLAMFIGPGVLIVFVVKSMSGKFADSKKPAGTPYPEMRVSKRAWLLEFFVLPVLIILFFGFTSFNEPIQKSLACLYLYYLLTVVHRLWRANLVVKRFLKKKRYSSVVDFIRKDQWYWLLIALLFPIPFFFYFFYHLWRKRIYRNYPRACSQCQSAMRKLSEQEEDEYLSASQQMEEKLSTVDYDVWKCENCQSTAQWHFLNRRAKYTACPGCRTKAYHVLSSTTIVKANYVSSGKGEKVQVCKFCGHTAKTGYKIPRLVHSSSSGSSSSSGGSSGGGSWGGGSSSGGGASSSW